MKEEIIEIIRKNHGWEGEMDSEIAADQILDLILSKCCANCRIMLELDNDKSIKQDK